MPNPTKEEIVKFIEDYLQQSHFGSGVKIEPTTTAKDVGLDSLDEVELIMELEFEYSIEIDNDQAEACKTLQELVELVYNTTR